MGHHCPTPRGLPLPLRRVLKIYFCPANERQDVNVGGDGGVLSSIRVHFRGQTDRQYGQPSITRPVGLKLSQMASTLDCLFFVSLGHACITGCCEEDSTLSLLFPLSFPASLLSTYCFTLFTYFLLIAMFALPILC